MGILAWAWTLATRLAAAGRATASKPSSLMVPDVGRSRPTTWLTSVLLPAPLCPSSPTTWPEATFIEMESLARTVRAPEPKCLWRSVMVSRSSFIPLFVLSSVSSLMAAMPDAP